MFLQINPIFLRLIRSFPSNNSSICLYGCMNIWTFSASIANRFGEYASNGHKQYFYDQCGWCCLSFSSNASWYCCRFYCFHSHCCTIIYFRWNWMQTTAIATVGRAISCAHLPKMQHHAFQLTWPPAPYQFYTLLPYTYDYILCDCMCVWNLQL